MEYVIKCLYDGDAGVWIAENETIPIVLEDNSLDRLMNRVKLAVPELLELNKLPSAKTLYFFAESRVSA